MITVQPTGLETVQLTPARVGLGFNQKPVKPEHEQGDLLPLERRVPHGRPTLPPRRRRARPLHHRGRPLLLSRSRLRVSWPLLRTRHCHPPRLAGITAAPGLRHRRRPLEPEKKARPAMIFFNKYLILFKKLKTYENVGSTFLEKLKFNIFDKILVQLFSIFWKNVELNFFSKNCWPTFF
jgi:hypothetical protein